MSRGRSVLRSMTSDAIPSAARTSAAFSASCTPFIAETMVMSVPSRAMRATPIGTSSPSTSPMIPYRRLCSKKSTGLSSRIADRRRPFASAGVAGVTIFSPGIPMNHDTGICEWIAPNRPPAPTTERNHERHAHLLSGEEPVLRRLVDDAVHHQRQEVAEHDLDHGTETRDRRPEGRPGESELGDRGVEDPLARRTSRTARASRRRHRPRRPRPRRRRSRGRQRPAPRRAPRGRRCGSRSSSSSFAPGFARSEDEGQRVLEQLSQRPRNRAASAP